MSLARISSPLVNRDVLGRPRRSEGPCTRTSSRCSDASNMKRMTRECCLSHIYEMTAAILEVFADLGICWWGDYGTLLGAARHQAIIPWDKDGDLGALHADLDRILLARDALNDRGYFATYWTRRERMKVRLSQLNHTNVDVFLWRERPDGTLYRKTYAACDRFKGREFPREWLEPFVELPFGELMLQVPAEWEKLLDWRYGDWQTPLHKNNDGVVR